MMTRIGRRRRRRSIYLPFPSPTFRSKDEENLAHCTGFFARNYERKELQSEE